MTPKAIERFWSKVDRSRGPDACWPWTGAILATGYGGFKNEGRMLKAHRVAFELGYGWTTLGSLCALHRCDNPPCCNPTHLFAGTQADNARDRNAKGRQSTGDRVSYENRPRGSQAPTAILNEEQVAEIRRRLRAGDPGAAIGRDYGVSRGVIQHIKKGTSWKHVQ